MAGSLLLSSRITDLLKMESNAIKRVTADQSRSLEAKLIKHHEVCAPACWRSRLARTPGQTAPASCRPLSPPHRSSGCVPGRSEESTATQLWPLASFGHGPPPPTRGTISASGGTWAGALTRPQASAAPQPVLSCGMSATISRGTGPGARSDTCASTTKSSTFVFFCQSILKKMNCDIPVIYHT